MNQLAVGDEELFQNISEKQEEQENAQNKHVQHRKKWLLQETRKYYEFISKYKSVLEQTEKKQKQRVYNRMAQHIGTRTTHQCRSHHQKVMKRHQSIDKFMDVFRKKLESMPKAQMSQKVNNQAVGTQKNDSHKINQSKLNMNQPCPSIQFTQIKIQQEQKKKYQNSQIQKINTRTQENIKISQQNHVQQHQEPRPLKLKISQKFDPNFLNSSQNRFDWNILDSKNTSKEAMTNSKVQKTIILSQHKIRVQKQQKQLQEMQQYLENQFTKNNANNHDFKEINQKKRMVQKTSDGDDCNVVNKQVNIILQLHRNKFQNLEFQPSFIPICENLSNDPESLVRNADYICYSIIQGQNLSQLNSLITQKIIEQTPKQIKIHYKSNEYSKMWVSYPKVETIAESQKELSSNFQEIVIQPIQKISTDMLQREQIIRRSQICDFKSTFPPSQGNFQYLFNNKLSSSNDREFDWPRVENFNHSNLNYPNYYPLNKSNQIYNKSIQKDQISQYLMERIMADKKLPKTSTGDDNEKQQRQQYRFKNRDNKFQDYQHPSFYPYNPIQQFYQQTPNQNTQKFQVSNCNPYIHSLANNFINQPNSYRREFQISRNNGFKQYTIQKDQQRVNILQNEIPRRFFNINRSQWEINPFGSKKHK